MPEKRISFHGHAPIESADPSIYSVDAPTVFLLSPANLSGARGKLLFRESSQIDLVRRLRRSQATIGEVFSFVSGLYFRGKLAYATRFANPPQGLSGVRIITSSSGLLHPNELITVNWLRTTSNSLVDPSNPIYRDPLINDAKTLRRSMSSRTRIVLLGSIATPKYVLPLLEIFGAHLFFPTDFVGRGDMSRGSLLLRSARQDRQLTYAPVSTAILKTPRRNPE